MPIKLHLGIWSAFLNFHATVENMAHTPCSTVDELIQRDMDNEADQFMSFTPTDLNGYGGGSGGYGGDIDDGGGGDDVEVRDNLDAHDDMRDEDDDEEDLRDRSYNINNVSKSLKVVNLSDIQRLRKIDGNLFCFLSELQGPMISSMALQQILCIQTIINSAVKTEHIVETADLSLVWKDNILDHVVHLDTFNGSPNYVDMSTMDRLDDIPHSGICDFRGGGGDDDVKQSVVPVADVFLAPVSVRYMNNGSQCYKYFWMVILRPRRNYNFIAHLQTFIHERTCEKNEKKRQDNAICDTSLQLLRNVLLHQYKISPNAAAFHKLEGSVSIDPFKRLAQPGSPDSLECTTNIFEVYRSMEFIISTGISSHPTVFRK